METYRLFSKRHTSEEIHNVLDICNKAINVFGAKPKIVENGMYTAKVVSLNDLNNIFARPYQRQYNIVPTDAMGIEIVDIPRTRTFCVVPDYEKQFQLLCYDEDNNEEYFNRQYVETIDYIMDYTIIKANENMEFAGYFN